MLKGASPGLRKRVDAPGLVGSTQEYTCLPSACCEQFRSVARCPWNRSFSLAGSMTASTDTKAADVFWISGRPKPMRWRNNFLRPQQLQVRKESSEHDLRQRL